MTPFRFRSFPRKRESSSGSPLSRGRAGLIAVAVFLFANAAIAAQFGPAQYALKDDDGDPITNFDLNPQLSARLATLSAQVPVGNLQGDVTLLQFYDLNCPYCREAAADVDTLVRTDKKLKLVFVPYAVLSVQSIQGAMVELAAAKMLTPEKYLEFHKRIYASRGTIDAPRVLAAAKDVGLDATQLAATANAGGPLETLKEAAAFGSAAQMFATPAYVINGVVILGHPGLKPLLDLVRDVRACGKVVC